MMLVPIETRHLFPVIDKKLIELLRSLTPAEWVAPTIAREWTVKDIAAHLLDGNWRTLSLSRDKFLGEKPPQLNTYEELVAYLNQLNADWVKASQRMSPLLITDLLESTGPLYYEHLASLDPFAPAVFSVGWAGEKVSQNWFHIAREYTEKWIHQQQIREAVGKPGLMTRTLFYPFINTFMQGLPYTYRDVVANEGTAICVNITSDIGGTWYLVKQQEAWNIAYSIENEPAATVWIAPDIAWKRFSKGIAAAQAYKDVAISGDQALGEKVLNMISVMA
jgi:uncharacterized protein (TIGR03083 family)